jgi:hypothetical protein
MEAKEIKALKHLLKSLTYAFFVMRILCQFETFTKRRAGFAPANCAGDVIKSGPEGE